MLAIALVLAAVVVAVGAPLRTRGEQIDGDASARRAELEARKEAKYREIRDADLDLRTGKLSEDDHRVLDRQLRAEAIEILRALDEEDG